MTTTLTLRRLAVAGAAVGALLLGYSCTSFFDVKNTNQPNLEDLVNNPTRGKLTVAATGILSNARGDIESLVWRLGSLGREGINLSGNNQPDYQEPYFLSALIGSGFGGALWGGRYAGIRDANIYLDALARVSTAEVSDAEKAASRGMANTFKALAFLYIVETRDSLGAPVDVDRPITDPPAPFVRKDSVYGYVLGLLDSARADLVRAGATAFPFPMPPALSAGKANTLDFSTPALFVTFNRALAAKARVLRATASSCGTPCYTAALTDLAASFLTNRPADFPKGAYFDFSNAAGDASNGLSDPLNSVTYYAHPSDSVDAQRQPGGTTPDQRVLNKIVPAVDTQVLGGISEIPGKQKFVIYFTTGSPDPAHPVPIIRDEELVLLRAEAEWFTGAKAAALADIDSVRVNAGKLAPAASIGLTIASVDSVFVKELLYNRRYSLLWEQGTRWLDARRFNRMGDIPKAPPTGGNVARVMPVPDPECSARGLQPNCAP
ncbi:MAG TPA: RagB/SusD family nutrient uptake outer membrane protein [Gemmatimonadales bacterium]|nr:RagB/SusD family nutrient uptake outer membrane protein [Gemmatimonadales bacterium]